MSFVFTFLCDTSQTKVLTLYETLDFPKNLTRQKGTVFDGLDKTKKNDLAINNHNEDNYKVLVYRVNGDKYKQVREHKSLSRSSISKSESL